MDCRTAEVDTKVVQDSSGTDSSSSDDLIPLSKLLAKKEKRHNNASSDSSDDKPLIKLKVNSTTAETPMRKVNTSTTSMGTDDKKAGLDTDESSDNEPLIKVAKMTAKAVKKPVSVPAKKSVDAKKKESVDDDSSDDEPLSVLATKLNPKLQQKAPATTPREATTVVKSKRNAARKIVKYADSSDSSDDEPLAIMKQKLIKTARVQKASGKRKKTKLKDQSPKDSSSDDDVPLVNLIAKKKSGKENRKAKAILHVSASRKRRGISDGSSEDEPLMNLVKKRQAQAKVRTAKKKGTAPKKLREKHVSGSSSDKSDDKPVIKAVHHPQVTKIVRIILERCDDKERTSQDKNDVMNSKKTLKRESEDSEESSEGE